MMVLKIILFTATSVLIVTLGLPDLEQDREEARSAQAFLIAQQIKAGVLPADTADPWGNEFDIQYTSSDVHVVTSLGSNMATPEEGYDSDDISTAMLNPPHQRTMTRKRIQMLITLFLAASPWLLSLVVIIRHQISAAENLETKSTKADYSQ